MPFLQPVPTNIIRDDFSTDKIKGTVGGDHLIHHRDVTVGSHASVGLVSFAGDDILEGSVPTNGQIHMFAGTGDDWLILDVTKASDAVGIQGHHGFGGHGHDTFQFTNIEANKAPIVGRLDDFDPTSDRILIENTEIDLTDLPQSIALPGGGTTGVRVVSIEHPEYISEDLGAQYFLAIGDDIFYALDGARDLQNGASGGTGEERHFLLPSALETLRSAETVQYENPKNFVPHDFYGHREDELNLNWSLSGAEVFADTGGLEAVDMFGGKGEKHAASSLGEQVMHGSAGGDVLNGNTGNDTIFGGEGDDLIAGGIDNDLLHGGRGNDMIWGGDGNDTVHGDRGDDYLQGGRGDDLLFGGEGNDTLFGGPGNDTLEGGGGKDAINRFHFYEDSDVNVITDFKVGLDLITLQDDIDPMTVELFENEDGNTVLNFAQTGSVELRGVPLAEFQDAAAIRADEDNPVITVTPDPEEEMLQELRIENGFYGNAEPPALMVDGIAYGDSAFQAQTAGGYTYVSADDVSAANVSSAVVLSDTLPAIPAVEQEEDEEEDENREAREAQEARADVTCFVATAAYRDPRHPDVVFLRAFRDQWLVHRAWGRVFVAVYWRVGPKIAIPVGRSPRLAHISKTLLGAGVCILRRIWV